MEIYEFFESKLSSFDKDKSVWAVLLDLSEAFDCMDRKFLLDKLNCNDVRGKILDLLESYLKERKQFVDFGGYISTCEKIEVGVQS